MLNKGRLFFCATLLGISGYLNDDQRALLLAAAFSLAAFCVEDL